nr:S8 family serine peptidase [Nocardioides luti]
MSTLPALALAAVLAGSGLVALPAPTYAADGDYFLCDDLTLDDPPGTDDSDSVPLGLLGMDRVYDYLDSLGEKPGAGVGVAVLDAGVSRRSNLMTVVDGMSFTSKPLGTDPADPHGTEVAGLIAAGARPGGKPTGIAPGARIIDVKVFDADQPDQSSGEVGVSTPALISGLNWVADNARRLDIGVANVSLAVTPDLDGRLERAVRRVVAADVVLVASSGNRPRDEADELWEAFNSDTGTEVGPGEDAAKFVWPAGYSDVLAVSTTTAGQDQYPDPKQIVVANSQTDVAAPSAMSVSVALNGGTCRLAEPATSYSAAEVSGLVALLRAHFPKDTAAQVVARLERTADGTLDVPTTLQGKGVVQPFEALTRPLHPTRGGAVTTTAQQTERIRASAPAAEKDVLAGTRHDAVWWGLLGGGVLVLALLLRPVLARRRD